MIEVSLTLYTLLIEALLLCIAVIAVSTVVVMKNKKKDRRAVRKLVDQIKHQSQTRLEETGSFLSEKYHFEGNELKKAVKSIDKAERKFFQEIINVYLKRDASGLEAMDATVAAVIDSYKSLSPAMPSAEPQDSVDKEMAEELARLKTANQQLSDELMITKETMGNMISEFGNMFGGGKDHELAQDEVVEKVKIKQPQIQAYDDNSETSDEIELETSEINAIDGSVEAEPAMDTATDSGDVAQDVPDKPKKEPQPTDEIVDDDEVDELLNSIDLSEDK